MKSIGIDIQEISPFKTKNQNFLTKIFCESERNYCLSKKFPEIPFAGKFAAKEAFNKAFFQKYHKFIDLQHICIENHETGQPYIKIRGEKNMKRIVKKIILSISHSGDLAVAVVVIK